MARKKATEKPSDDGGRAINFRASADLAGRLDRIADALGLDVSNLVRMVLKENLQQYEERARLAKEASDRVRAQIRHVKAAPK